jgi:hypothetical protein
MRHLKKKIKEPERRNIEDTIVHFWNAGKNFWSRANKYTRAYLIIICIPIFIIVLVSPVLLLPFTVFAEIISTPNTIERKRKAKELEKIRIKYVLFLEALNQMLGWFDDDFKNNFKSKKEFDAIIDEHHHAGRFIRNNLGLWDSDKELTKFFIANGITHADDMSAILMKAFYRNLNGVNYSIEELLKEKFEGEGGESTPEEPINFESN